MRAVEFEDYSQRCSSGERCHRGTVRTTECETNKPCGDRAHAIRSAALPDSIILEARALCWPLPLVTDEAQPEMVGILGMRFGRTLIIIGLFILALGLIVSIGEKLPIRLGRLPGDIVIRGKHSVFYFPIVTSLLISLILSVVLWLFGRR